MGGRTCCSIGLSGVTGMMARRRKKSFRGGRSNGVAAPWFVQHPICWGQNMTGMTRVTNPAYDRPIPPFSGEIGTYVGFSVYLTAGDKHKKSLLWYRAHHIKVRVVRRRRAALRRIEKYPTWARL